MLIDDISGAYIKNKEAEKLFSVSQSQLSKWRNEGNIPAMRGYTKFSELFEYWSLNKADVEKLEANKDESEKDESLAELKRKIQAEILEEKRLANKKEKGALVEKKEVVSAWVNRLSDLRGGLLSLKSRISSKAAMKTDLQVKEIVEKEVDQLFKDFSREGRFCKKT